MISHIYIHLSATGVFFPEAHNWRATHKNGKLSNNDGWWKRSVWINKRLHYSKKDISRSIFTLGLLGPGGTAFIKVYMLSPELVESVIRDYFKCYNTLFNKITHLIHFLSFCSYYYCAWIPYTVAIQHKILFPFYPLLPHNRAMKRNNCHGPQVTTSGL